MLPINFLIANFDPHKAVIPEKWVSGTEYKYPHLRKEYPLVADESSSIPVHISITSVHLFTPHSLENYLWIPECTPDLSSVLGRGW